MNKNALRNAISRKVCGFEIALLCVVLASGLQLDFQLDFAAKGIRFYSQLGP